MGVDVPVDGNFQSYQNTDNFKNWRATKNLEDTIKAIRATKNLEDTMLTLSYQSWQRSLSEQPKSCQRWKLTFLSTVAFRTTKIPTTLRANIPIAFRATKNLEDAMLPVNSRSWEHSFQSYLRPGRRYVSRQLMELTTVAFRATTIFSTVGCDILGCSFQSYLKIEDPMIPVDCLCWQP